MKKIPCLQCGTMYAPDDDKDKFCSEECLELWEQDDPQEDDEDYDED